MKTFPRILKIWLPIAAAFTLLTGMIYIAVQQNLRMGANDIPVQLAEDAANRLKSGQSPEMLFVKPNADGSPGVLDGFSLAQPVEISESLAPYVVLYDVAGKPIAGTGLLHGSLPTLPPGVLDYTAAHGEDRITWQPEPGVRSAVVIVPVPGSNPLKFVMAGRSLREVEAHIDQLTKLMALGWVLSQAALLVVIAVVEFLFHPRKLES